MEELTVYGSEDCLGWEKVQKLLEKLRKDSSVSLSITVKDPLVYDEEFREKGLVICPSFLLDDELIAVGTPDYENIVSSLKSDNEHD